MLLVVDVGNTNITFGVYRDKELVTTFRLMSKTPRTSDEYGVLITELLSKNHLAIDQIDHAFSHWSNQTLCKPERSHYRCGS